MPLVGGFFFPPLEVWVYLVELYALFFPDWFGRCGVTLSRSGVVVVGGMFALGNFGATLGGRPGDCVAVSDGICCSGWPVVC